MTNKLKAAVIGGVIVGLLSVIFAQIPFVSLCCCLWGIGGGAVAGLIYIKGSPTRVSVGDGAILGALAGVVGAVIYLIIGIPIALLWGVASMNQALQQSGVQIPAISGTVFAIISSLIGALGLIILSTLGGLLSIPIFEKRKDSVPPPPPSAPGGYAA
jgi:hypothetical protein